MKIVKDFNDDEWCMAQETDQQKDENDLLSLLQNRYPLPPPLPLYEQQQRPQIQYVFLGKGNNLKEKLTEFMLLKRDAQLRFGDTSLEGLLKGALAKDVLEKMKLSPQARYPYLEAQITEDVRTGKYFEKYEQLKKQAHSSKKEQSYPNVFSLLTGGTWMQKNIPKQQRSLYLKTGFYVRGGMLYAGTNGRKVGNLTNYVKGK